MSGGVVGAQAASLTFMFGISDRAEDKIIRRVKDTLTLMVALLSLTCSQGLKECLKERVYFAAELPCCLPHDNCRLCGVRLDNHLAA